MISKEDIIDILKNVKYPGYSRDIVSFGIIKDIQIHNNDVTIILSFKSNNEEIINQLNSIVKAEINAKANIDKLKVEIDVAETGPDFQSNKVEGIDKVDLDLVWDPPWEKSMMSEAAKLELNL